MTDCIFCRVASGEIPCQKISENEDFLAFLDIKPFTQGHTLVIPKRHFRWTYDIDNFGEFWEFIKTITHTINKRLSPEFISYLTMGKEVPHAHVHLIPRYQNDHLVGSFSENLRTNPTPTQLEAVAAKINHDH